MMTSLLITTGIAELFPCPEPTPDQLQAWKLAKGIKETGDSPHISTQVWSSLNQN
jgi:hypothetical protein